MAHERTVGTSKKSLNSIHVSPIGILGILVYTTGACAIGDLDTDESTIAPPAAP